MKHFVLLLISLVLLVGAGCGRKKARITDLQRKQAAGMVSEAEFAVTIRDFPRAEKLLRQATETCPDNGSYWFNLGTVCRRMDKRDDAKKAYEGAITAYGDAFDANPQDPAPLMRQIYVYALLGRADDAQATLKKAHKRFPDDDQVRGFDEDMLKQMFADPSFKALAI
jgi:tetratricopeptide (TPR) repeat protein